VTQDSDFFSYAGSKTLSENSSGAAWPVYKEFEVERTESDVFIYAPPRRSEAPKVYGTGAPPLDKNEELYAPLRDEPALFLTFAGLSRRKVSSTDAGLELMLEWAKTYGVLGIQAMYHWGAPRPDYPPNRRESLRSFSEAVREAARCLELYRAAKLLDGNAAETVLDRYRADGKTLREKQEWAAIVAGDIVGARVEAECYPLLLRAVEGEKNSKAHYWYEKRSVHFVQGWGFRSLLGAMYFQMMLFMTGGGDWKPCKRPGCYRRVTFNSGKEDGRKHRTHSNKEFCDSKACKVWWSENYGANNKKAKAKRERQAD
jgi:hypothetical protein